MLMLLLENSHSTCALHCIYRIVRIESLFALIRLQWVFTSQPHLNHRGGGKLGRVACEAAATALTCVWLNGSRRSFEKGYPYLFGLVATFCNGAQSHSRCMRRHKDVVDVPKDDANMIVTTPSEMSHWWACRLVAVKQCRDIDIA